jgi:hypothetical protein
MTKAPSRPDPFRIEYLGAPVDLSHLEDFVLTAVTESRPNGVGIRIRFSNHCYSEAYDDDRHADRPTFLDPGGRERAFCPQRHALSHHLPELVRRLPEGRVHLTPENNFVRATLAEGAEYRMYFNVRKKPDVEADLLLVVESAYAPDKAVLPTHRMQKVRFKVLVDKVLRGERLSFSHR